MMRGTMWRQSTPSREEEIEASLELWRSVAELASKVEAVLLKLREEIQHDR